MQAPQKSRKFAATLLAYGVGVALFTTLIYWGLHPARPNEIPKVVIGLKDRVYFDHAATKEEAESLGDALRAMGFFNGRGTAVLLSKGTQGTVISFVLDNEGWIHPDTVFSFEEIGRRVAQSVGGLPIKVRLTDSVWTVHKDLSVGKVAPGGKDEIYYFGAATAPQAEALGRSLNRAGYLIGSGATVVLSKGDATVIAFVVDDGVWNRPDAVAGFLRLSRDVAPSVGGLPVTIQLLNSNMEPKKQITLPTGS
jgi:hypothetical protein